jgi:two-component system LytT family response regulator
MQPSLQDLESRLDPAAFVRVSRSALVQLSHVAEVVPQPAGGGEVVLRDGALHDVSRRRLPELLGRLAGPLHE